jgi:hypothetical protein
MNEKQQWRGMFGVPDIARHVEHVPPHRRSAPGKDSNLRTEE